MDIAKLIQQINSNRIDQTQLELVLAPFDFASKEALALIDVINEKQYQVVSLIWRSPRKVGEICSVSVEEICDYFLKFLARTPLRQIDLFIPIAFSYAEMQVLQAAIKAITVQDASFKIKLCEIPVKGVIAKRVFKDLLLKLENNTLDTQTITIPTSHKVYLPDGYDKESFRRDLATLVGSGKFTKIVFEWNENNNDPIIDPKLNKLLEDMIHSIAASSDVVTHFEIDMTQEDFCREHVKFAEYIARYAQAEFDQMTDQKRQFTVNLMPNVHRMRLFAPDAMAEKARLKKKSSGEREKENKSKLSESLHLEVDNVSEDNEIAGGLKCH